MDNKDFDWKKFWKQYRNIDFKCENDLFIQVGKTINGSPISAITFKLMLEDIVENLALSKNDVIMEMCCGNGLLTLPLSEFVYEIYAFDFTEHLIDTAKKTRKNKNITYEVCDANEDFFKKFKIINFPGKYLMNDSLGYFKPIDLKKIIINIKKEIPNFNLYITGIPNYDLKWNFYNTEERRLEYFTDISNGEISGRGIGYWWKMSELADIAKDLNLSYKINDQHSMISSYRSNILFSNEKN